MRKSTTSVKRISCLILYLIVLLKRVLLVHGLLGTQPNATPLSTFKRLTLSEAKDRRECGLCYYCDDKFAPGHRCRTPHLFMIEASHEDDEVLNEHNQKTIEDVVSESHQRFDEKQAKLEISIHAITSSSHPHTIRVVRVLRKTNITILLDNGSTHNFIDPFLVLKLWLPIVKDNHFQVTVANRTKLNCDRVCLALPSNSKSVD